MSGEPESTVLSRIHRRHSNWTVSRTENGLAWQATIKPTPHSERTIIARTLDELEARLDQISDQRA
jgi:hypothetical protein